MAKHTITIPDRRRGRELRTIVWDDEAGTVSGDHWNVASLRRAFAAAKPVTVGSNGGTWTLHDPAHDPAEFLTVLGNAYWPVLDEPLRSSLPAIFDGVELPPMDYDGGVVVTYPDGFQDYRPVFLTGADGADLGKMDGGELTLTAPVEGAGWEVWYTADGRIADLGVF